MINFLLSLWILIRNLSFPWTWYIIASLAFWAYGFINVVLIQGYSTKWLFEIVEKAVFTISLNLLLYIVTALLNTIPVYKIWATLNIFNPPIIHCVTLFRLVLSQIFFLLDNWSLFLSHLVSKVVRKHFLLIWEESFSLERNILWFFDILRLGKNILENWGFLLYILLRCHILLSSELEEAC